MRKQITKKARFEVFKRDNFTCMYCGRKAPEIILEIDHIKPVSKGGSNEIINLITSCFDCNRGKGKRILTNKQEIEKEYTQLQILSKQKDQLELLLKWKDELLKVDEQLLEFFKEIVFIASNQDFELNDTGLKKLKNYIKKYDKQELIKGIQDSFSSYYNNYYYDSYSDSQKSDAFNKAFNSIPLVINSAKKQSSDPLLKDIYYCRGILRNRLKNINYKDAVIVIRKFFEQWGIDETVDYCKKVERWANVIDDYNNIIDNQEGNDND
jgi:hypothetical protein